MADKSVHQNFDPAAIQHFGLVYTSQIGVYTSNAIEPVIHTDSKQTYENIKSLLSNVTITGVNLKTKKKAFILPLCPVSQDRLKISLKEHGITVTNDYELADLIITHNEFHKDLNNSETILTTLMMAKLYNYMTLESTNNRVPFLDTWIKNNNVGIIYDWKVDNVIKYYNCDMSEPLFDNCIISGMAINLAYKIANNAIDVVDTDTVLNESANKQVLTETLVSDILRLCNSYNSEDNKMAGMIIPAIDYTKNLHLFWELAKELNAELYRFKRNKDVLYWSEVSNLSEIAGFNAEEMIDYLIKNDLMTNFYFKYFEPIARKEIQIDNRELYVFKVQVKPEYQKYLT